MLQTVRVQRPSQRPHHGRARFRAVSSMSQSPRFARFPEEAPRGDARRRRTARLRRLRARLPLQAVLRNPRPGPPRDAPRQQGPVQRLLRLAHRQVLPHQTHAPHARRRNRPVL
uniref:(northern house mosquito) hypothetical protein n=1 Tax=Culex pipiens TaxID=7175 RepID=A0A8D8JH06_CULPI